VARDPYKYFRIEARELLDGLASGVLELEKGGAVREVVARLLRLAHTLKGASRVVHQPGMAEAAHALEDTLAPHREGAPVPRERTSEMLRLIDEVGERLKALEAPVPPLPPRAVPTPISADTPRSGSGSSPPVEIAETVRVAIGEMDSLLEGISESAVHAGALERVASEVGLLRRLVGEVEREVVRARSGAQRGRLAVGLLESAESALGSLGDSIDRTHQHLLEGTLRLGRELRQIRDEASGLRLVPAHTLFAPLARAVRDAAQARQRLVALETTGGDVRLEAHVLSAVRDALLHVVRNAVAHGIEPAADRVAAGKPASGRIHLLVEQRGGQAAFICRDDGRGLDLEAVAQAAREKGLLARDARVPLDAETASRLIFEAGLSTSVHTDEISGRGVGLDVVRDVAARFKGEARAHTEPGRGTTIEMVVPITLSSVAALAVGAGDQTAWLPLESVARALRVQAHDITAVNGSASIRYGEAAHPFAPLTSVLGIRPRDAGASAAWTTVLVKADGATAAIGVDRLRGVGRIVVRALPSAAGRFPAVSGATFDLLGDPQLVLDPRGLGEAIRSCRMEARPAGPPVRPPILVIDDSLTTRMLEQSILETAGYEVELATSGEEGLEKARARRFALILVDVEMPGINGFEFIARAKADPALAGVPAILVTSLDSPEDRRRGREVGAHAYIVKGDFDEGRLRGLIRDLIG
jgi:two-component system, chemotaxis family, sensor kinase CheA